MRLEINRICVPTDFSQTADHAVHYAAAIANTYGAALYLLHVVEHPGPLVHHPDFTGSGEVARAYFSRLDRALAAAEEKIAAEGGGEESLEVSELIKSLEAGAIQRIDAVTQEWWSGLEVHRDIRSGHPVKEILHYVEKLEMDLVVMGAHGHSKLTRMLLGSVTERVVRACTCPVTVIRHPEHHYSLVD
jgi:nucleotide-binding universal stress UspA family protein